jgi:tetratricopeptide (TPR) repeat protein
MMISPMLTTTPGDNHADGLEMTVPGGREQLVPVGPSMRGYIYRSVSRSSCYRLVPREEAPLAWRQALQELMGKPVGEGLAAIGWMGWPESHPDFYAVRYDLPDMHQTLAEALTDPNPRVRLEYAARVLEAAPGWWRALTAPIWPLPADVAFTRDGPAFFLTLPPGQTPDVRSVFAVPLRGFYLSPELVRGLKTESGESQDRYALAVALSQCFAKLPPAPDGGAVLAGAARGAVFGEGAQSTLPFWLEDLPPTQQAHAWARRLAALPPEVRLSVDLALLAQRFRQLGFQMEPHQAAVELRDSGRPQEAYNLLLNVLLSEESADLLLLAGDLASRYLTRPLEAIDLYERAILMEPDNPTAYEQQFKVIAAGRHLPPLVRLVEGRSPYCDRLDKLIRRGFARLPSETQFACELDMARYLLWRQNFQEAADFTYAHLFEGSEYLWWKFDLNLAYTEALMGLGELGAAKSVLDPMAGNLMYAFHNRNISEGTFRRCLEELQDLQRRWEQMAKKHPTSG